MDKFIDKDGKEVHIGVIGRGRRIPTFDELAMALPLANKSDGALRKPMVNLITEENKNENYLNTG